MGKNTLRLLLFALRWPDTWHTYGTDRKTRDAILSLVSNGILELNRESRQFRLLLPNRIETKEN